MIRFKLFQSIFALFFSTSSFADSSWFTADCLVSCQSVQAIAQNETDLNEFRSYCMQTLKGTVMYGADHATICMAPESRIVAYKVQSYDLNGCKTATSMKRWSAVCNREAEAKWPYGWELGQCVSRRSLYPANWSCN